MQAEFNSASNVPPKSNNVPVAANKVIAVFISALLIMATSVVAMFWFYAQLEASAELRSQNLGVLTAGTDLLSALKDAETGERGFLLTGDAAYLQPYFAVQGTLEQRFQSLTAFSNIPAAQQHLTALRPLLQAKIADLAQLIALRRNQSSEVAIAAMARGTGKRLMDGIRAELGAFIVLQQAALAAHETAFQAQLRQIFKLIVFGCFCVLLLALLFAHLSYKQSQQRLKILVLQETQALLKRQDESNQQLTHANATLLLSEEKLAVTLNSIGDAVIATDAQARVSLLNPIAEALTGWTQAQAMGRPIADIFNIINKINRAPALIPLLDTIAHGTVQGLANHTVLIARDGSERDIADSCAPIRDRDAQVIGAVLVFRDVSEDHAVQQKLSDSAALIQTVLNTVADGIITLHANDGSIEKVNPAAEQMFGFSAAELHTQNFSTLFENVPASGLTLWLEACQESIATGTGGHGAEVVGRRQDGTHFPMEIAVSEMQLGGERYFTGILRDISVRKEVEDALLKAGALQNAIFNSANFSSIATDAKGVIQIFNVGAERMLGYTAAEVMNQLTPADISEPSEIIRRAQSLSEELGTLIAPGFEALVFKASRGIEDIYELSYIRKDGSRFPAVVSVTALRDAQNTIIGYLLIGTDNTARKQAEEALLKAGALQNAIFNSANFSSIATDANGVIQIFNVGAERMLGYAAIDVMNKITPADISDPSEMIARAQALSIELGTLIAPGFEALVFKASRGIEDIYELSYIRKDGSRFPAVVSVTALRDAQNAIIGYLLIGTDNTARKQIEAEQSKLDQRLRDQQFYTRSLIESSIDALMTTDPAGIITDVNKQMEALTGCTRDELIGAPFKNYFTDPERAEAGIKRVLAENKVINYELTARARIWPDANGAQRFIEGQENTATETVVSYNASTFYDRDRKLQGVFAAARDITERKRLDLVLQENNVELISAKLVAEKANLAKSDFLSSMSHELRTPLNAILGFAQLLEVGTPAPTVGQRRSIEHILQAGWYLLELINEILDLALIESGKLSLSTEPVALADVLQECQAMIEPQAHKRGIRVTFPEPESNASETAIFVKADRTRLKQVLINLLSNAVKYNCPEGAVEVTLHKLVEQQGTERIRICVTDTGAGLGPEKIAQLFQPFNRLGQEANVEEGTGIGLVVSKRLVELMHGSIGVDSTPGSGCAFWIILETASAPMLLPLGANSESKSMSAACAEIAPPLRRQTLLYVEDNPANMLLVEQIVASRAHVELICARDAISGIELARSRLPSLILMDINLPGMSGIEALAVLLADSKTAHIPVIALSANAIPRDIEKGLEAGFFCYLTKPIKVAEFLRTLDLALTFVVTEE